MPSPNSPREFLIAAKELISTPEKWIKGDSAKDIDGISCHRNSNKAVCFCITGALANAIIMRLTPHILLRAEVFTVLADAAGVIGTHGLIGFNDHPNTTHAMVLDLFDKAITLAEGNPDGLK